MNKYGVSLNKCFYCPAKAIVGFKLNGVDVCEKHLNEMLENPPYSKEEDPEESDVYVEPFI